MRETRAAGPMALTDVLQTMPLWEFTGFSRACKGAQGQLYIPESVVFEMPFKGLSGSS